MLPQEGAMTQKKVKSMAKMSTQRWQVYQVVSTFQVRNELCGNYLLLFESTESLYVSSGNIIQRSCVNYIKGFIPWSCIKMGIIFRSQATYYIMDSSSDEDFVSPKTKSQRQGDEKKQKCFITVRIYQPTRIKQVHKVNLNFDFQCYQALS